MRAWSDDRAYWGLVEELMKFGWYRAGRGPIDELGRTTWAFREGHLLEAHSPPPLQIAARDEEAAMRLLLGQLQARRRQPRAWALRAPLAVAAAHGVSATAD
jgi:hypothetical protein